MRLGLIRGPSFQKSGFDLFIKSFWVLIVFLCIIHAADFDFTIG